MPIRSNDFEREGPPANGPPTAVSAVMRPAVSAGRGRPATGGQYRNKVYMEERVAEGSGK
jgi:hypothetical protein